MTGLLIDASANPIPAIWQGLMLCLLPLLFLGTTIQKGRYFWLSMVCYAGTGVMLLICMTGNFKTGVAIPLAICAAIALVVLLVITTSNKP